ncbi:collagen alpha-1(I) chain-like [Elgaria multicarinata webbii]|uniref:collagen alpha-1(I) chain-like n=1 Tax=Elgaria multicarinata webbii TaxID=159646 RepID=UPI002FCCF452
MAASSSAQQFFPGDAARRRLLLKRRRPPLPDAEPRPWAEGWRSRRSPEPPRARWGNDDGAWPGGDGAQLCPPPPSRSPPPRGRAVARPPPEGSAPRQGWWDRPGSPPSRKRKSPGAQPPPSLRGGRWSSSSPQREALEQDPSQDRRGGRWGSSPQRTRRPQGPSGEARGWGSPQREQDPSQDRWGSSPQRTRRVQGPNGDQREQDPSQDLRGGRWSSSPQRTRRPQGPNGDQREQNPSQDRWGSSPQRTRRVQGPNGDQREQDPSQDRWGSSPQRTRRPQGPNGDQREQDPSQDRWGSSPQRTRRVQGPNGDQREQDPSQDLRGGRWGSSPQRTRRPQGPSGETKGWGSPQREQDLRGGRWSSLERQGSEQRHQASGRWQTGPGVPEGRRRRRQESPNGDPGWDQRQGNRSGSGGRWSSPEKRGGEQQPLPRRRQPGPSGDSRDWGDTEGPKSRGLPAMERFQGKERIILKGRRGDRQSPALGKRTWGSPVGCRRQESPPRELRAWGSPTQGEGQECSGSPRRFDSEQGQVNQGRSRWGGLEQVLSRAGSSNRPQSSNGGQQQWSQPTLFTRGWDPEEADLGSCERGGKEDEDEGAPKRRGSPAETAAGIPDAPLQRWTPREPVVQYWMQCQAIMSKQMRRQLLSACPLPALPNRMSEVPCLNTDITLLLSAQEVKELRATERPLWGLQEELLEMLGPAMTLYEMAEEAIETEEAVDAMELREWTWRLIRYIGSLNQRITAQRRMQVLGTINPRLKCATSKMTGLCPNGKLFPKDKVQLLKEIIQRFPQLTEAKRKVFPRKYQPFSRRASNMAAYRQRKFLLGPHPHPQNSGAQALGQSPATAE